MARSNTAYFINPNSISIIPNANGTTTDVAVNVTYNTKIKLFQEHIRELTILDGAFQEWSLTGRNRRLLETDKPYAIYARLKKNDYKDGYIVFAPMVQDGNEWKDPYILTPQDENDPTDTETIQRTWPVYKDALPTFWPQAPEAQRQNDRLDYWWVKIGEVSAVSSGERTVDLDTGILGTEQYNNQWQLDPDALPTRVVITPEVDGKQTSTPPYVKWVQASGASGVTPADSKVKLKSKLIQGWDQNAGDIVDHWGITRKTGTDEAHVASDTRWNQAFDGSGGDEDPRSAAFRESGEITLYHPHGSSDDFSAAVASTFTITAYGKNPEYDPDEPSNDNEEEVPEFIPIDSESITILAETMAHYELELPVYSVRYNPTLNTYTPAGDITPIMVRAIAEDGKVFYMKKSEITLATLRLLYKSVGSSASEVELQFTDNGDLPATATLPIAAFSGKQSQNLRLVNASDVELAGTTVSFVQDGQDGDTPVITIGSNDKHWYIDGVDTGVKAEGEDGTGVQLSGTRDVIWNADKTDPNQTSLEELYPGNVQIGDCYVVNATRHLYFFNGSSSPTATLPYGWTDLGEFKGADGVSSYMHMAWADSITFDSDGITPIDEDGFTTVYGAGGHNYEYDWIGFCTDNNETDPTTFQTYKWNYQKGKDGDGYEYVYMRAKVETAPLLDETITDSHGHTRMDDEYLPALSSSSTAADYASSEFTDDPQGVSQTWPYEYQAVRKKVNGQWQAFSAATLHRSYSDSSWLADLDNEMDSIQTTPTGNVVTAQQVQSQLAIFYGNVQKTLVIDSVQRNNETPITVSGGGANFVNASWTSGGLLTLSYAGGASFTEDKDIWTVILHPTDDSSVSRTLKLTVNWIAGRIYNVNPSVSQINVGRTDAGGYDPANYYLSCGFRRQNDDGTISETTDSTGRIDALYNIYFRRRLRSTGAWEQSDNADIYYRYGYSTYKAYVTSLYVSTYDAVEFLICRDTSNTVTAPTGVLDRETIPVVSNGPRGEQGDSPYLADLDTDVVMLHTTGNGKPTRTQTLTVIPSLRKGEDSLPVSITAVKRNGTAMTHSGNTWTGPTGITVIFSGGIISIAYTTAAQVTGGMDSFVFTIAHVDGVTTLFSDDKKLTVSAYAQDQYQLLPSADQIIVTKVGNSYSPSTFTLFCGYRKIDVDQYITKVTRVLTQIDGLYNLYFRRHLRNSGIWEDTYYLYPYYAEGQSDSSSSSSDDDEGAHWLTNASVATYDAVEFIMCRNTEHTVAVSAVTGLMYTAEIPVIQNGSAGATGPSYYYKGEWYDQDSQEYIPDNTVIQTTEYERPFVSYTYNGVTAYYLYIGTSSITTSSPRTSPASDPSHWTPMQSENKFVIAEAIFSDFAKFGSAVINKDWMISANGRIDGVEFYVTDLVTGKRVDAQSSGWSDSAYSLFDNLNPKATSKSLMYVSNKSVSPGTSINLGNVTLSAANTYSVRAWAQVAASNAVVKVRLSRSGVSTDVMELNREHASSYLNSQAFFRVEADGEYSVTVIADSHGSVNTQIETFDIAQVSFAPIYALDFFTGGTIQRDLFTSGFIRKDKTVINRLNVRDYTVNYANVDLQIDKCGTFIEIVDNMTVNLKLPLLYRGYNYNRQTEVWTYETKVYPEGFGYDADFVRSLVGTRMIIYLRSGHLFQEQVEEWDDKILKIDGQQFNSGHRTDEYGNVRIDVGSTSCDISDSFLWRISHETNDTNSIDFLTHERQILNAGEFVELECVSDTDSVDNRSPLDFVLFDGGYEVIYWRVNKKGKMLQ